MRFLLAAVLAVCPGVARAASLMEGRQGTATVIVTGGGGGGGGGGCPTTGCTFTGTVIFSSNVVFSNPTSSTQTITFSSNTTIVYNGPVVYNSTTIFFSTGTSLIINGPVVYNSSSVTFSSGTTLYFSTGTTLYFNSNTQNLVIGGLKITYLNPTTEQGTINIGNYFLTSQGPIVTLSTAQVHGGFVVGVATAGWTITPNGMYFTTDTGNTPFLFNSDGSLFISSSVHASGVFTDEVIATTFTAAKLTSLYRMLASSTNLTSPDEIYSMRAATREMRISSGTLSIYGSTSSVASPETLTRPAFQVFNATDSVNPSFTIRRDGSLLESQSADFLGPTASISGKLTASTATFNGQLVVESSVTIHAVGPDGVGLSLKAAGVGQITAIKVQNTASQLAGYFIYNNAGTLIGELLYNNSNDTLTLTRGPNAGDVSITATDLSLGAPAGGNILIPGGIPTGEVLCINSVSRLSHCTSVVGTSGECHCFPDN